MIAGATTSQDGRNLTFTFPVRNPEPVAQVINLSVLANDLGASVSPVAPSLAPFAQITATLTMSVPNSLHGTPQNVIRREITVIGRDAGNRLIDGLTYIIGIND